MNPPCDCCADAIASAVEFVCDHVAGSAGKCGFPEFGGYESDPPIFYRKKTNTEAWSGGHMKTEGCGAEGTSTITEEFSGSKIVTDEKTTICSSEYDCSGDYTYTRTARCSGAGEGANCSKTTTQVTDCDGFHPEEITGDVFCDSGFHLLSQQLSFIITTSAAKEEDIITFGVEPDPDGFGRRTRTLTEQLETPDTTDAMKARAEAQLVYTGTFVPSSVADALRSLASDEVAYDVSRTKFKLRHTAIATCYLKVWLVSVFIPEGEVEDEPVDFEVYTWEGVGNPCHTGEWTDFIFSPEYEVLEPATNGLMDIRIARYSYLADYEPPADGSANGWPA